MRHKLRYPLVLAVVLISFGALIIVSGMILTFYQRQQDQKENEKYFVSITAKNVTIKGMDLQIECLDNIQISNLEIDVDFYYLEKWKPTGWAEVKHISGEFFDYRGPMADAISPKYRTEAEIEWVTHYGKLPSGVYRAKMPVIEAQNTIGECNATFFVVDWWNLILFLVVLGVLWMLFHYCKNNKNCAKEVVIFIKRKKKKLVQIGVSALLLGLLWSIFLFYDGELKNKKFELQISVKNLTAEDATIIIKSSEEIEDENLNVGIGEYWMEKWTPIGWRQMQFLSGDLFYGRTLSAYSIYPGNICEHYIKWTGHYGELDKGIYRIAMPIDGEYNAEEKESDRVGTCYATFVILK